MKRSDPIRYSPDIVPQSVRRARHHRLHFVFSDLSVRSATRRCARHAAQPKENKTHDYDHCAIE
jgi:hypothetical protein